MASPMFTPKNYFVKSIRNICQWEQDGNMNASVNKEQINCMVEAMLANPSYAKGFQKEKKENVAKFWNELNTTLNSLGPPTKSTAEWKKVWIDQKRYIRKNLQKTKKNRNKTGGGPNREYVFSSNEMAIIDLLSLEESIEGLDVEVFGTPKNNFKRKNKENENEDVACAVQDKCTSASGTNLELNAAQCTNNSPENLPPKKRKLNPSLMLSEELETQKKICEKIEECTKMCYKPHKDIDYRLKKIGESLQQLQDTQSNILEETKRHNQAMEQLRNIEIQNNLELTKRQIEIQDIKLKKLQD